MFSTRNLLLRTMARGMVAEPGQAYLGCLKHLSSCPWPQSTAEEDEEQQMDRPGRGQGALPREGGREDAEAGGASVILGCCTQPQRESDMHVRNPYISRTVISNTETNKSEALIKIFFYFKNIYYKNKLKKGKKKKAKNNSLAATALLKSRRKF